MVTQPPAPSGRNKKITRSPTHILAESISLKIFTPVKANETDFLDSLIAIEPDLCITAAYGNYLPKKFLAIPKYGTYNIHPSFLPLYRGASPVQRALENGDQHIGVSILKTVTKMDAGPIAYQLSIELNGEEKATDVLKKSFDLGINKLIELLPLIWENKVNFIEQDETKATFALKLSTSESYVNFNTMSAATIHNKCRAFSIWPGIWTYFSVNNTNSEQSKTIQRLKMKIITTCLIKEDSSADQSGENKNERPERNVLQLVKYNGQFVYRLRCSDGSILGLIELQPENKRVQSAKDIFNGLRGQVLKWEENSEADRDTLPSE